MTASWQGILIGVSVAAPVGPMAILCLRRSVMFGRSVGLASGMGVASAHALYSALAIFGLQGLSMLVSEHTAVVRVASAVAVGALGVRVACASPSTEQGQSRQLKPGSAYASAFGLGLTNPLTILSLASLFAGLDLTAAQGAPRAILLVLGVFAGSSLWWLVMTRSASALARRFTVRMLSRLNRLAGPCLVAVGASIALR